MVLLRRARQFFRRDVWVDLSELPAPRRAVYRTARLWYLAVRGFLRDEGLLRASALSFDTVLGLVPFLLFGVAVLKALGAYDDLIHAFVRPWLMDVTGVLGDHGDSELVTLRSAFFVVLDFVERTDLRSLGLAGLAVLLYITVGMLHSVEASMNHIFAAQSARGLARKIADYTAMLVIAPLCVAVAAAVTAHARRWPWLGGGMVLQLGAVLAMTIALSLLYLVMPFTRVRLRAALLGGFVASLLWYGVLAVHLSFQVGVARYNALYSTFAAFPLFLVWLFMSWVVVLFGAELAAAYGDSAAFRERVLPGRLESEPGLALRAMREVGRAFLGGARPRSCPELADLLGAPEGALRSLLDRLVRARLLTHTTQDGQAAYVPAVDVDAITVAAILNALDPRAAPGTEPPADAVEQLLEGLRHERQRSEHNWTLRQLVERCQELPADPDGDRASSVGLSRARERAR